MGRALFSVSHPVSAPAVRSEPEAIPNSPYEKWSHCNAFDPDSDEFFNDAEYEAFIDPSAPIANAAGSSASTSFNSSPILSAGATPLRAFSPISDSSDSDSGSGSTTASSSGRTSPRPLLDADANELLASANATFSSLRHDPFQLAQQLRAALADRERGIRRRDRTEELTALVQQVAEMLSASNPNLSARMSEAILTLNSSLVPPAEADAAAEGQQSVSTPTLIDGASAPTTPVDSTTDNSGSEPTPIRRRALTINTIDLETEESEPSPMTPLTPESTTSELDYSSTLEEDMLPNVDARRSVVHIGAMASRTLAASTFA